MKSFDERLAAALIAVRVPILWLSTEAKIDYTRLVEMQRGALQPTDHELDRMALALNCSVEWLAKGYTSAAGRRLYEQLSEFLAKDQRPNEPIMLKPRDFFRLRTLALMISGSGSFPPPQ